MILLRLISWPYARQRLPRCLLTMAGIVLGVAVFVGIHTANRSVLGAFHQTVDRVAGAAQLQISAGEPGFDEEVLDRVRDVAEVRAAAPVIETAVSTGRGNLLILGVDMLGDRSVRSYDFEDSDDVIDDPLVFLAQPDSLLVTRTFAEENALSTGSRIPLRTMQGNQVFTVRGIMKPGGLAGAFGGNLAIMDIYAAQKMLGRSRKFDRIDVALVPDATEDAVRDKLQALLGPGFQVEKPSSRGRQFEATTRVYALATNISSLFALYIGMFLIYNTFAIAVTERRSEIGILRALGATQSQIQRLFLMESGIAGLVGSVIGVAVGVLIARGLTGYIGGLLEGSYGLAQQAGEIQLSPKLIGISVAMGMVTSLIAAVVPARSAARVDPVKALQKGRRQSLGEGESRTRFRWAVVCAAASVAALVYSRIEWVFYLGYLLALLTAVLLAPALSLWLSLALRPVLKWLRPVEGTLAADSLIQAPRRTSGTVSALMLSLALVISLGGEASAIRASLDEWMRVALNPDLFVATAESLTTRTFVFPASLGDELRAMDGVAEVQLVRSVKVMVNNSPAMIVAADIGAIRRRAQLRAVHGNPEEMYRLTLEGKGVLASENYSYLQGGHIGDVLEIPTPSGTLRLPIVGVVRDFSDQQGTLFIPRDLFIRYWNDTTVNFFRLYLKPGFRNTDVRKRILDAYGSRERLFVLTNRDVRSYIGHLFDQWFAMTYVQIGVAVLVALLGIVNTLTVSITDRRREFGVLQAVGGLRNQVRRTVWMEAGAIGVIGLVLGFALGAMQLYYTIEIARRDLVGTDLQYVYPFGIALMLAPIILAAAFAAALGPAEGAVRGSLVEALEYE